MLNLHRSAAAPSPACADPKTRPRRDLDLERAPVVFVWLLYRQDRFADAVHLETLYRLDRVGGAGPKVESSLQPSAYYGQGVEVLRELLRVRQHQLLPPAASGCRWDGPHLVTEVKVPVTCAMPTEGPSAQDGALPAGRRARLAFASAIARRLLHGPEDA